MKISTLTIAGALASANAAVSGVQPYKCVTATTYDGGTASFMSFTQSNGDGESVEYITDINSFISMRGQMYAQEMANTCEYCEMDGLLDLW